MEVLSIECVGETSINEYVYDLETEEGTYVAGDGILVKNTDSCYVKFNISKDDYQDKNGEFDEISYMKENFRLAEECAQRITKTFKKPIDLEFEKIMYPFFLYEKKRYAYQEWTEYEKPHHNLEFKGVSVVRRDYCKFVKEVCVQLFEILMRDQEKSKKGDIKGAVKYAQDSIKKLFSGQVPVEDLIISNSLKGTYKVDGKDVHWTGWTCVNNCNKIKHSNGCKYYEINRPHVRLSQKIKKIDPINHPKPPDRVPYVFIVKKGAKLQWEKVEHPDYLEGCKIDTLYYFDHQLKEPIMQIFDLMVEDSSKIYEELRIDKINKMNGQKAITNFFKVTKKKNDIVFKNIEDS